MIFRQYLNKKVILSFVISIVLCISIIFLSIFALKRKAAKTDNNLLIPNISNSAENSSLSFISSEESSSEVSSNESTALNFKNIPKEKTEIKPSTGSVITAPEFKYKPKEDPIAVEIKKPVDKNPSKVESLSTTNQSNVNFVEATGTRVNIRKGAGTNYSAIGKIDSGKLYLYLGQANDRNGRVWYNVNYNNLNGWVTSEFSKIIIKQAYSNCNWKTEGSSTYFIKDGQKIKGWELIDGRLHYFDLDTGALKSRVGIDVSKYQGKINWPLVRASGVEYAIIRVGYRGYVYGGLCIDPEFYNNIKGAQAVGIKCGVYFYSVAQNQTEAVQEANFVANALSGISLQLPVYIDEEHVGDRVAGLTKEERTNNAIAFLETIRDKGYTPGFYTYYNYYNNYINKARISNYPLWLAYYTFDSNNLNGISYNYWQYTSGGSVNGISGRVDMNIIFDQVFHQGAGEPETPQPSEIPTESSSSELSSSTSDESSTTSSSESDDSITSSTLSKDSNIYDSSIQK